MKELIEKIKSSIVKIGIVNNGVIVANFGSAFLVSKEGHILTCGHVIGDLPAVHILFHRGNGNYDFFLANCIYKDKTKDFAILKIDKSNCDYLELGNFNDIGEGDEILFAGFPLKIFKTNFSRGMISAKGPDILGNGLNAYQIDGPVNNGNSGGPLINKEGKVVGIITLKYSEFDILLKDILSLGKMTGVTIRNEKGGLDIGETFYNILELMRTHINVGIGHAFSIEYAKEKLKELKIIE